MPGRGLQGVKGGYKGWAYKRVTGAFQGLQGVTKDYRGLEGLTRGYGGLPRCYKRLQEDTRGYNFQNGI